jgi:transposase InsO family protein
VVLRFRGSPNAGGAQACPEPVEGFRILSIIDEASRECLALPVARKLRSEDVLAALADLFVTRGPPAHIRSDNGPEFIATAVQQWLARIGVKTLYITPGSPWENGYCESLASPPCGSMARCAMNCSTARSSTRSLKPEC